MTTLQNYIHGEWRDSVCSDRLAVENPATLEVLAQVPMGAATATDVDVAVAASVEAQQEWRDTPVIERVQPLYKLKQLLEEHREDIAKTITQECGKTLGEARGEMQRAIENVEMACGTPALMQSEFSENIARGIDEFMIRQPIGVGCCIAPFNFPGMITFWFLPYAIACGNGFIVKPSEKVPLTMMKVFALLDQIGLPKGLVNMVHGGKESVDALLAHPDIKSVSFVGSSQVARYIYAKASEHGKRVQAQGGAKNPIIILPDADLEMAAKIVGDSVYGCAGQRCLAASNIVTVGDEKGEVRDAIVSCAEAKVTGYGLDEGADMGPVISAESKSRVEGLIDQGVKEGAKP
ncbi:MAG: aldehyde dehydrogenase family protein, partial [Verrucomicrobiales bacterium]|nr:aldehyde dehydrogenase family protein [Verrucomicrobiales bacterium]